MSAIVRINLLCAICVLMSLTVYGQDQGRAATLTGQVVDQQSAAIEGATVLLLDSAAVRLQQTRTEQRGVFIFSNLRPGAYVVEVARSGNHPRLSISEDGRILLAFQGRPSSEDTRWKANQLYLAWVGNNGSVSTPARITKGDHPATHPDLVAGTSGRVFVAWDETGDQKTQAMFSRAWIK